MTATVDAAGGQTLTPLAAAVDSLCGHDNNERIRQGWHRD
jgi:hypothetical protein